MGDSKSEERVRKISRYDERTGEKEGAGDHRTRGIRNRKGLHKKGRSNTDPSSRDKRVRKRKDLNRQQMTPEWKQEESDESNEHTEWFEKGLGLARENWRLSRTEGDDKGIKWRKSEKGDGKNNEVNGTKLLEEGSSKGRQPKGREGGSIITGKTVVNRYGYV